MARHYGDPLREQRTAMTDGAIIDRSHRGVLRVGGGERLTWLHSLTSQHVEHLEPDRWTQALVLSPHGHVEHHLTLVDDGSATWIHVEPGTAPTLLAYLESMRFWSDVVPEDVSPAYAVVSRAGGTDEIVPRAELESRIASSGLPLVGHDAWEALRVAAGHPRFGFETDHRTIPHELGWLETAVHLDKGCYRGQETVARVHNLGRPPRRLVRVHLDGTQDELPPPHTPVTLDDKQVGYLGTAVHHAELGPIALAVIKRQVADDARLVVAGMAAAAERLVDA